MDWKLRFRNLQTGREVERVFRERAEFVSQARAVDKDIWSELLSANDPNGNVLTVDEVRRLVAAHRASG
jgi:cytochrome P450